MMNVRPRRSVLYVPAANTKAMEKSRTLDCDAVIFDLEDAVAPSGKVEARRALREHFTAYPEAVRERVIRINAASSAWGAGDLEVAVACKPDAVLLPKVETPDAVLGLRAALDAAGGNAVVAWAMIETPLGIVNIREIARLGRVGRAGLGCLVVGTNDIARETGLPIGAGRPTMAFWLAGLVIHARAFGLSILDGVFNDFRDTDGLLAECREGALLGFDGKTVIHPAQIATANQVFSPGEAALTEARAIVAAFALPENASQGVVSLDGKMVERLHLTMAKALIAKAH